MMGKEEYASRSASDVVLVPAALTLTFWMGSIGSRPGIADGHRDITRNKVLPCC